MKKIIKLVSIVSVLFLTVTLHINAKENDEYSVNIQKKIKENGSSVKAKIDNEIKAFKSTHTYSTWADKEIDKAIKLGIIPYEQLPNDLTKNVDRYNFFQIALNTLGSNYRVKTLDKNFYANWQDRVYDNSSHYGLTANSKYEFRGNELLTREQALVILHRLGKYFVKNIKPNEKTWNADGFNSFDSINAISSWASEPVHYWVEKKLYRGKGNGNYDFKGSLTYEQAIALSVRFMEHLKELGFDSMTSAEREKMLDQYYYEYTHPTKKYNNDTWIVVPNKNTLEVGKLSDKSITNAENVLNAFRHSLGLNEIYFNDSLNDIAQHDSFLMEYTDQYSHHPQQLNAPDWLYKKAEKEAGAFDNKYNENIDETSVKELEYEIYNYIYDNIGISNLENVGHRLNLLDNFEKIGIGHTQNRNTFRGISQGKRSSIQYFPTKTNFPIDYLGEGSSWSVSITNKELENGLHCNDLRVKITNLNTNETVYISQYGANAVYDTNYPYEHLDKPFVNFNDNSIIFNPMIDIKPLDRFKVEITGLEKPITYTTMFY